VKKKIAGGIVLGLFALYWIGAAIFLNVYAKPLLATWGDGLITYRWAFSVIPGIVHAFGFEIRHQDKIIRWTATVGSVTTGLDIMGFTRKEFHAVFVRGSDMTFRFALRRRYDENVVGELPPFEGIGEKPPEAPSAPPNPQWAVKIEGAQFQGLKKIWVDRYQFEGDVAVAGGFGIKPEEEVWVGPATLDFTSGRVSLQGKAVLEPISGHLDVKLDPFDPNAKDISDLKFVNAKAELHSHVDTLNFLNVYLGSAKWIRVKNGGGPLSVKVQMEKGVMIDPSTFSVTSDKTELDFLGARLTGKTKVVGQTEPGNKGTLTLNVDDFEVTDPKTSEKFVDGSGLLIVARAARTSLNDILDEPDIDLTLNDARMPDLRLYNRYLPKHARVRITNGEGRVTASIQTKRGGGRDKGSLVMRARQIKVDYDKKLNMKGDLEIKALLKQGHLEQKRFDISGTQISLENVVAGNSPRWAGKLSFPKAKFHLQTPFLAHGEARCQLKDIRPFLAVYMVGNKIPEAIESALEVGNLDAVTWFDVQEELIDFTAIQVKGDGLKIEGRIRILPWEKRIRLITDYKAISVALDKINDDTRLILNDAHGWYDKQSPFPPLTANEL